MKNAILVIGLTLFITIVLFLTLALIATFKYKQIKQLIDQKEETIYGYVSSHYYSTSFVINIE
jgi:hypothetical protein